MALPLSAWDTLLRHPQLENVEVRCFILSESDSLDSIGTTQHLGVNCGTQRSDKVEHNYGSDKVENSHNSCYNSGETLKDERVSTTITSTRNGSSTSERNLNKLIEQISD